MKPSLKYKQHLKLDYGQNFNRIIDKVVANNIMKINSTEPSEINDNNIHNLIKQRSAIRTKMENKIKPKTTIKRINTQS